MMSLQAALSRPLAGRAEGLSTRTLMVTVWPESRCTPWASMPGTRAVFSMSLPSAVVASATTSARTAIGGAGERGNRVDMVTPGDRFCLEAVREAPLCLVMGSQFKPSRNGKSKRGSIGRLVHWSVFRARLR